MATNTDLDYIPTKKITNIIKKLIDTRARFMFGREPFFDVRPVKWILKRRTRKEKRYYSSRFSTAKRGFIV